jgi:hypothetical protein
LKVCVTKVRENVWLSNLVQSARHFYLRLNRLHKWMGGVPRVHRFVEVVVVCRFVQHIGSDIFCRAAKTLQQQQQQLTSKVIQAP